MLTGPARPHSASWVRKARLEKVEFGYWPFVKELTHSETVKHIVNHPQVTTDLDKGMALSLVMELSIFQDSTCAVGDGNSQVTFVASSKAAEGVEISSGDEKDDNHSIASSSLSNSSTITAPLSPKRPCFDNSTTES
ncbi:pleckstrin y domain containing, M (with RUN domain) member 2 [Desmophyllum pertusum]|uniref:Pleckstrin y domain containing, M (With RUN domain) member 2 n=1 Tax=Desmophyllum pertusum TaxID=174260 RepID=A0A9W9ZHF5_9CNID|nr:pleckstrin y domain containing, M (with RUN domain) member 2 [Desmophyllum pertusum]